MPSGSRSIIVSSGIQSAPPFTLGAIPMVSNVAPDILSDSIMSQGAGPPAFIIVGAAPSDATTEIMQSTGTFYPSGGLTDSLAIGRGCTVVGAVGGQLAIGFGVTIDALGNANNFNNLLVGGANTADDAGLTGMQGNTVLGFSNTVSDQASNCILIGNSLAVTLQNSNCVIIGNTNTRTGASIGSLVAIGNGTNVGSRGVAIGDRANAAGGDSVGIGQQAVGSGAQAIAIGRISGAAGSSAVAIGVAANAAQAESIAIGHNSVTTAGNQLVIGGIATAQISVVIIGAGDAPNQSPAPLGFTLRTSNIAPGNLNTAGPPITIATGIGSGNAVGGVFGVDVPLIGASGTTLQTPARGLEIRPTNTATETFLLIRDVDNGALERVSVGIADSGGTNFKLLRIPN